MSAPSLRFALSQGLQESFDELFERVLAAERAGFSTYYTPDHFYTGQGVLEGGAYGEAWTAVAAVGARCQRIRVGGEGDGVFCEQAGVRKRSLDNPGNFAISAAPNGDDQSWTKASDLP